MGFFSRKREVWYCAINVKGDKIFRDGAKCTVVDSNRGNGAERINVRGLSRGGRKVTKYVSWKYCSNVRPVFYAKSDPENYNYYDTKEEAQKLCEEINENLKWLIQDQAEKDERKKSK